MPKFEHSIEINSSKDKVWEIISDLDNEPEYWYGTKSVHNISREGNVITREITQNFGDRRIEQKVVLHPKDSIEVQYLRGVTEGVKILTIESLGESKQRLSAHWDIHFPGIFKLGTPMIKGHVEKGTVMALERIKNVAEGRPLQKLER
ncbi:MAG: type II toxin-antitoxin system RatA family toxin [Nitrososphaerales archaeon]